MQQVSCCKGQDYLLCRWLVTRVGLHSVQLEIASGHSKRPSSTSVKTCEFTALSAGIWGRFERFPVWILWPRGLGFAGAKRLLSNPSFSHVFTLCEYLGMDVETCRYNCEPIYLKSWRPSRIMFAAIRKQMKRNRRRTKNGNSGRTISLPDVSQDPNFTLPALDIHYWRECPMLAACQHCEQALDSAAFLTLFTIFGWNSLQLFVFDTVFSCVGPFRASGRLDPFYIMFLSERSARALKTRWAHIDEGLSNFPGDWDFPTALALARGPQNPLAVPLKSRLHVRLQKHQKPMRCLGNCWTARERSARRAKLPLQTHVACTPTGRLMQVADFHFQIVDFHQSQPVTTFLPTFLYLSCFRCPLCQGRVCRSGVPEEHDWWVIPAPESRAQSFVCSQIWRVGNLEFKTWVEHIGTRIWMIMF